MPLTRLAACVAVLILAASRACPAQSIAPAGKRIQQDDSAAVTPGNASEDEHAGESKLKEQAGGAVADPGVGRERVARKPQAPRPPHDRAEPMQPPSLPVPVMTAVVPKDGRVEARQGGFVVLAAGKNGDRIVAMDPAGKNETELFDCMAKVDRWWVSADRNHLVWVAGGRLCSAGSGAGAKADLGVAPAGNVSFSADNTRIAFIRDGKLVIADSLGRAETVFEPEAGLMLGDSVAFSADAKTIYTLVSSAKDAAPDGIGSVATDDNKKKVARFYQAAGASLRGLTLSPDGVSLAFIQGATAGQKTESLRLFVTNPGDVRTIARAATIENPTFDATGSHVYFSAKGANGRWQAWAVTTSPDAELGDYLVRRLAEVEGKQFRFPVPAADGKTVWMVSTDLTGNGALIGSVEVP